jgi:hypothetical protein
MVQKGPHQCSAAELARPKTPRFFCASWWRDQPIDRRKPLAKLMKAERAVPPGEAGQNMLAPDFGYRSLFRLIE